MPRRILLQLSGPFCSLLRHQRDRARFKEVRAVVKQNVSLTTEAKLIRIAKSGQTSDDFVVDDASGTPLVHACIEMEF